MVRKRISKTKSRHKQEQSDSPDLDAQLDDIRKRTHQLSEDIKELKEDIDKLLKEG